MEKVKLQNIYERNCPKRPVLKNTILAFVGGGIMGAGAQVLSIFYQNSFSISAEEAIAPTVITFVFIASILTGLGLFDRLAQIFGAGVFVPITGFSNSVTSSALEGKSEGLIYGIGAGMFKLAGSVIAIGVVSAYGLGLIRFLIEVIFK